jgi:anti-repressor protein
MNLPSLHQNQTMSSREIAEMTGKNHADVMRDIRNMLLELTGDTRGLSSFASTYFNSQNKEQPCYLLPKRETLILTSGYSITQRAKIIDRWQELEDKEKEKGTALALPDFTDPAIAARAWAEQYEARKVAELKNIQDAPKVEFAMAVRRMEGACKIGEFGKVIGIGQNKLFKQLRQDEILMADNMPYQRYIDQEFFVVIEQTPYTDRNGKAHPTFTTMVTGKGQVWLEKKYKAVVLSMNAKS